MRWDVAKTDLICLTQKTVSTWHFMIKGTILPETATIYEALCFLCPLTICAKILMQDQWDMPLPDDIQTHWRKLAEDLNSIIPTSTWGVTFRNNTSGTTYHFSQAAHDIFLHVFCNASLKHAALRFTLLKATSLNVSWPEHLLHHWNCWHCPNLNSWPLWLVPGLT